MANEPARIRTVQDADLPAARALLEDLNQLQRAWRVFAPREGFTDEVLDHYRAQVAGGEAIHLVAEVDGRIVGMAFGRELVVCHFSDRRSVEISSVVVRPEHRGRGIARALVRALAADARRRGVDHLNLATFVQNEPAMRFWESVGFTPRYVQLVARTEDLLGGRSTGPGRE